MATVEFTFAGGLTLADPAVAGSNGHTFTSGNRMVFMVGMHSTFPTVSGITDDLGSTWTQLGTVDISGQAYWEVWTAVVPSTGLNDLTVDLSAAPSGGNGYILLELSDADFIEWGSSNTGSYSATQTPAMPTLATDRAGLILVSGHNDSNFVSTWTIDDSFTKVGSASTRIYNAYRLESAGVSAAPTVDFSSGGLSETGEAVTLVLYLEGALIKGTLVAGEGATVNSTHTAAFNMDAVTRTINVPNAVTVGGRLVIYELSAEPDGVANTITLFVVDNGSGKSVLKAKAGTGASSALFTEP